MPPTEEPPMHKTFEDVAAHVGVYSVDAFYFIQDALDDISAAVHPNATGEERHVTGQQLSIGLRDKAIANWGLLAATVLSRWGVYETLDFGKIVYALIDAGLFNKTEDDSIEDFRNVYDFRTAFEQAKPVRRFSL